jgi:crossover junction endodeoxyribonuclease RuvC
MTTVILGIDQSYTGTGITCIQFDESLTIHYDLIETIKEKDGTIDYSRRILDIVEHIDQHYFNPYKIDCVVVEGLSYGSRSSMVFNLGGLFHSIELLSLINKIPIMVVPPKTLKKFWTGKGNASKYDMVTKLEKLYKIDNKVFNIPFKEKYKVEDYKIESFNNNVVDSLALCLFPLFGDKEIKKAEHNLTSEQLDHIRSLKDNVSLLGGLVNEFKS